MRVLRTVPIQILDLLNCMKVNDKFTYKDFEGMCASITSNLSAIRTGISKSVQAGYLTKESTGKGAEVMYQKICDIPEDRMDGILIAKKRISKPKKQKRPMMWQLCDILNNLKKGDHFTIDRFMEYLSENKKVGIKTSLAKKVLSKAASEGYLTTEKVPGYKKVCYIKLHNIPEDNMKKISTSHIHPVQEQVKEPISNLESIIVDSKIKIVNISVSVLKDMENVIGIQHEKNLELKKKIGEVLDENVALKTQISILTAKTETLSECQYKIDTDKFYNLE